MRIIVDQYSTDGSSLSKERCEQILLVYSLCSSMGNQLVSYRDIQNKAEEVKLFGFAKAPNVIRTIFPLLKKLGFVEYSDNSEFPATSFFTDLGKAFISSLQALHNANELEDSQQKERAIEKVQSAIEMIMQIGISNLSASEYKSHNILLAIEILRTEKEIFWNELLYILQRYKEGQSITQAIDEVKEHRNNNVEFEYVNSEGSKIQNTAYSYVRSFLSEAGIIENTKSFHSKLKNTSIDFIKTLPHYGY